MDTNDTNKDQLDEILKEMNDWVNNEIKTKGFILGSEVQDRFTEELKNRRFIIDVEEPWKRPNDEG